MTIFDTVLEMGDHGSFNSWGRDRYCLLKDIDMNTINSGQDRELPLLDAIRTTILRNNRWRCDHGWDIDLDDGSSNYEIRKNLYLNGGLRNREGFYRTVENNIIVQNTSHPHVWFKGSEDVFRRNIVFRSYAPIRVAKPWGNQTDYNLLPRPACTRSCPPPRCSRKADATSIPLPAMRCSSKGTTECSQRRPRCHSGS